MTGALQIGGDLAERTLAALRALPPQMSRLGVG
jgi:hypothetical protein